MQKKERENSNLIYSRVKIYFLIIILLLLFICLIAPEFTLLSITSLIIIIVYSYVIERRKEEEKDKRLKEISNNINIVTKETLKNTILPLVILKEDGTILYDNLEFNEIFKDVDKEEYLSNLLKEIQNEDNEFIDKEVQLGERTYAVIGNYKKNEDDEAIYMLYFIEQTEYKTLLQKYNDNKSTVGIIIVDNYDELIQSIPNESRPQIIAKIEKTLYDWASPTGGLIVKMEKDRFVYVFSRDNMREFENNKFNILDSIREINLESRIPITLSMGISLVGASYYEQYKAANSALEIALGRGGDQVVIKKEDNYEFFGGRTQEVEKRTKVKARTIAHALQELIEEAKNVIIMGHTNADVDSIGSAIGLYRIAKEQNKETNIVLSSLSPTLESFMKSVKKETEYDDVFVDKNQALAKITPDTLLIVVDTNRKTYVDVPELLDETEKVVLIDHHRRTLDFIENSILTFHEVYASSTAELVTEIISYSGEDVCLNQLESEALYSGIMIDTKNFTFKTGVRTFEAAAYLKKNGIDIIKIKQWFETDLETYNTISEIVRNAELIDNKIAISVCEIEGDASQLIAAKSADEILTISGITASFVLYKMENVVGICGRSVGDINVQLILEKLGGGGHITVAGAQLVGINIEQAKTLLGSAIEEYFKDEV